MNSREESDSFYTISDAEIAVLNWHELVRINVRVLVIKSKTWSQKQTFDGGLGNAPAEQGDH